MTPARTIINKDTLVPLSLVLAIFSSVVWFVNSANSKLDTIETSFRENISALKDDIKDLKYRLATYEAKNADRWTISDQKIFVLEMSRNNPEIKLPDPWVIVRHQNTTDFGQSVESAKGHSTNE